MLRLQLPSQVTHEMPLESTMWSAFRAQCTPQQIKIQKDDAESECYESALLENVENRGFHTFLAELNSPARRMEPHSHDELTNTPACCTTLSGSKTDLRDHWETESGEFGVTICKDAFLIFQWSFRKMQEKKTPWDFRIISNLFNAANQLITHCSIDTYRILYMPHTHNENIPTKYSNTSHTPFPSMTWQSRCSPAKAVSETRLMGIPCRG